MFFLIPLSFKYVDSKKMSNTILESAVDSLSTRNAQKRGVPTYKE
jgi:hypothetical protein